jgi:hypothetical protein
MRMRKLVVINSDTSVLRNSVNGLASRDFVGVLSEYRVVEPRKPAKEPLGAAGSAGVRDDTTVD